MTALAPALAQVPSVTGNSTIRFTENNNIFYRSVNDVFSAIDVDLSTGVTGTLPAANGGTGIASYTVGDILYASGATTLSKLAGVATGNALISGGVSTAPSWGKIGLTTHVSGTLPVANGGTGAATFTNNRLLTGNGTSAIVDEANATFDGTTLGLLSNSNSQTNNISIQNSNSGSSAAGMIRFWNDASTASNRGLVIQLPSSAYSSPYAGSATYWLYENGNQIWATNNAARMLLNATGLYLGAATAPSERLHVSGNAYVTGNISAGVQPAVQKLHISGKSYLTDDVGIGVNPASARLHVVGTSNGTLIVESTNTTGTAFQVKNTSSGGGFFQFSTAGSANAWPAGSFLAYDVLNTENRFWVDPDGDFGIGGDGLTSLSARFHVAGAGATSGTNTALFENSAGTDILIVRDDAMSAFGTTPVSTEKLLVRGATSDNTTKAFVAERSSGTDCFGVQNDGKVSVNNAAYTEALTVNGKVQSDGLVLTNQTDVTTDGNLIYGNGGSNSGYFTIGDNSRAMAFIPAMIERQVIDYLVNWSTGRKGAFWTVPARFDGWKIAKAYIEVTSVGAGAGDDELTIEIGGVGEGVQVITAGTHTLVMDDVINTDDIITFNVTAISATPAQGLNVSLELSKQ